jgi:hypothetical protein
MLFLLSYKCSKYICFEQPENCCFLDTSNVYILIIPSFPIMVNADMFLGEYSSQSDFHVSDSRDYDLIEEAGDSGDAEDSL